MASTSISLGTFSANNNKKFTISFWIKRSKIGTEQFIYYAGASGANGALRFNTDNTLKWYNYAGSMNGEMVTYRRFMDVSSWYHIVLAVDTTQATASNRVKIYVNGVQETSFSTESYPSQDAGMYINNSGDNQYIGFDSSSSYLEGSLSHFNFIDNTQYAASDFGSFDSTDGIWKINTSPSVTYGTNGFYLKFEDSSDMDKDSSGNGHTFSTSGNLMPNKDNPSNNLCSVNWSALGMVDTTVDSNKNCGYTILIQQSSFRANVGTLPVSAGKWYAEFKLRTATGSSGYSGMGVLNINPNPGDMSNQSDIRLGQYGNSVSYNSDGTVKRNDSTVRTDNTFTAGDIISVAMDLDNGFIYWAKNGTWENSGDPTSGATGTGGYAISNILETGSAGGTDPGSYVMGVTGRVGSSSAPYFDVNYGNGWYNTTAIASPNSDGNGYGAFSYTVPTGYLTICTKNISTNG